VHNVISAIGKDVARAAYQAQTQMQKQMQALGHSIDRSKIADVGQAMAQAIDGAKVARIRQAMAQTVDSAKVVNIGRVMEQALPEDLPQIAIPALSWRQGVPDSLNLMQRTCAAPELIHTKPQIIVPDSEDVEAVALQKPVKKNKGGRPSHRWRYKGLEEIALDLLRRGDAKSRHGCAVKIVEAFGYTPSPNVWMKERGAVVFGASPAAAIKGLSEYLKNEGI
jgi:hypothetical protein